MRHTGISRIARHRTILFDLAKKNFRAKYAGSVFGALWAVINPLILTAVITFIFTEILRMNIRNSYLFIISGMLPWTFFAMSLQEASGSLWENRGLLKQFSFPRELIPLACVLTNAFIASIGLSVVSPFFAAANPKVAFFLPFFIPVVLLHAVFTAGLALVVSSLYVRFKDIGHVLNVVLLFWLWLTPVFYDMSMVPLRYQPLFALNPATIYIELYRDIFFFGACPGPGAVVRASLAAAVAYGFGYFIFRKQEPFFAKRL